MRGYDQELQSGMFSYVALEDRIPADHPLRGVRKLVDAVLAEMSKGFEGLYSKVGTSPPQAPFPITKRKALPCATSIKQ
jgi:hypothetical protein